jgi:hypothetical protein
MKDLQSFDHRPDPELGAALKAALDPPGDPSAFVARVMAQYDHARQRASIPTVEILASWFRPGIAAAAAALVLGFLVGRMVLQPTSATESIDAAMAPAEGPGLAALVTAADPPDASVVFASLVEPQR